MKYGNLTLGQIEAGINKIGGEEAFMRLLREELVISEAVAKKLFERLSTTIAVPVITSFIGSEHFVIGTSKNAKVKIRYLSENFKANFLSKVESGKVAAEDLAINKLLENSFDPAIVTTLGGEAKVEITLGQFFAMFAKQPNGEKGALLTNGNANVGYIRDSNGVLWAAYGGWGDDGWCFLAYPLGNPRRWDDGLQFLSR